MMFDVYYRARLSECTHYANGSLSESARYYTYYTTLYEPRDTIIVS